MSAVNSVILTLFCPPKFLASNDGTCGAGASTRPTLPADKLRHTFG